MKCTAVALDGVFTKFKEEIYERAKLLAEDKGLELFESDFMESDIDSYKEIGDERNKMVNTEKVLDTIDDSIYSLSFAAMITDV